MIVHVLCEDATIDTFDSEHGLSLYIETASHRILFDAGQTDVYLKNADKLGIDVANIDIFVLSHGHYDHGGGLKSFLKNNEKAKIYLHQDAFGAFYHGNRYIGLDSDLLTDQNRFVMITHDLTIDHELTLLCSDALKAPQTSFTTKCGEQMTPDAFRHEIYLEVSDTSRKAFFTGCAHKGVVSIAQMAEARNATHLVGGFHLPEDSEESGVISIAQSLGDLSLTYYTGHCTSPFAYAILSRYLGNRIHLLQNGLRFPIGDHASTARFLFRQGYNCSQAVFGAFADELGIDFELAMRLASSFGGGMGRLREVCGAVSGMFMVCGVKEGYSTPETGEIKAAHYKKIQELASIFREMHGSLICRDLLGGTVSNTPTPTARTEEFYRLRPCERLIASAASIAEKQLYNEKTESIF